LAAFVEQVEQGMEDVLNRLNIPSHRDIEELNQRISQLATRVEELGKA
jgi:poly(hydroxyalkanoate) granule-associated protein